ncbi:hypothetical protein H1S01_15440 [Heliobacterium chlorum]|uniref:SIR2-like domain-containing protein n=1 Tax=Heliobacterium chlorum TaxID=2698 RepID=A0ABR7T518_HELCL|nr:hypothetical protein [Heliobacterium chlorum]MBC9785879.1 hypothetical protein [Heliobacterium chlorum]
MTIPKIAVFFGAGAEIGYGLPNGGRFALDLFRMPLDSDKNFFKEQIKSIQNTSIYASKWMPKNYHNKRIHVFGKGEFEGLIASSLEYKRDYILDYFDKFDEKVAKVLEKWYIKEDVLCAKFKENTNFDIGGVSYGQVIRLNKTLAQEVSLFNSEYFSAFIKLLEINNQNRNLKKIVRAFLELLVGAFGQNLISKLNEELFEDAPDALSVFDDLSGVFSIDYRSVGQTGMEIVLEEEVIHVDKDSFVLDVFYTLGYLILEDIYSGAIDYQALIDSHYRYLYNPKAQWAKFCRICIFLHCVRRYITEKVTVDMNKLSSGPGFYHDLINLSDMSELVAIGTTNYNSFVSQVIKETPLSKKPVYHLNGSVDDYYDPYLNTIYTGLTEKQVSQHSHILVPLIFTQSGIKPLTSVTMARRYVELYDDFMKADYIVSIGFGFNGDDGHINGLVRSLIEDKNKKLCILYHGNESIATAKKTLQEKLRLTSGNNIHILNVDDNRNVDGVPWYQALLQLVIKKPNQQTG